MFTSTALGMGAFSKISTVLLFNLLPPAGARRSEARGDCLTSDDLPCGFLYYFDVDSFFSVSYEAS